MRFLGFVFLLLVVLVLVGWLRGWIYVDDVGASSADKRVVVDSGRMVDDAKTSAAKVGAFTEQMVAKLKAKASKPPDASGAFDLDATLVAVDTEQRRVDLRVQDDRFALDVPTDVVITVGGSTATLAELKPGGAVTARVRVAGAERLVLQRLTQ